MGIPDAVSKHTECCHEEKAKWGGERGIIIKDRDTTVADCKIIDEIIIILKCIIFFMLNIVYKILTQTNLVVRTPPCRLIIIQSSVVFIHCRCFPVLHSSRLLHFSKSMSHVWNDIDCFSRTAGWAVWFGSDSARYRSSVSNQSDIKGGKNSSSAHDLCLQNYAPAVRDPNVTVKKIQICLWHEIAELNIFFLFPLKAHGNPNTVICIADVGS